MADKSEVLEKPILKNLLEASMWSEMVKLDFLGTICDRMNAYYAVVTYYDNCKVKLCNPLTLAVFLWCFYKAKREAYVAWQMVDNLDRKLREGEKDALVAVLESRLLGLFGKHKRAKKIMEIYRNQG